MKEKEIFPNERDLVTICQEIATQYTSIGLVTPVMLRYIGLRGKGYNKNKAIGELYRVYSEEYANKRR